MKSPMKDRHGKGVANHPDPKFCGGHREVEAGLEDRIKDLHSRVHRGAYRAQPSRKSVHPES
jgi:hypothetical protein